MTKFFDRGPWRVLLLVAFGLLVFLPGFFTIPPVDRDEPRFAQASRQMLESGDWVDIRFQDEARNKKPVGIYWLQAACAEMTGMKDAIWSYRLPSLLGALAAMLLTWRLGALLFGDKAGLIAALLLGSSLVLTTEARLAKTDAVLLAFVLLAQIGLARAWQAARATTPDAAAPPLPARTWIGFWCAIGCGILIKGPIVPMVAGLTALVLVCSLRRWDWLKKLHPLKGLGIVVLIAAPWLLAIALKTKGAFFQEALGHDLFGKVAHGQDRGSVPPGLYLLVLPFIFWPGSLFVLRAMPWIWAHRIRPPVLFCLAWFIPYWLCFELIPTKLPHYMLPICPALALLAAAELTAPRDVTKLHPRWHMAANLLWLGFSVLLIGCAGALPWLADHHSLFGYPAEIAGYLLTLILVLAACFTPGAKLYRALGCAMAAACLLYATLFSLSFPRLDTPWLSSRVVAAIAGQTPSCPNYALATLRYDEPSLIFLTQGRAHFFGVSDDAIQYLNNQPPGVTECRFVLMADMDIPAFEATAAALRQKADPIAHFRGFNYGHGGNNDLTLYHFAPNPSSP